MATMFKIDTQRWLGWLEVPARVASWAASPIMIVGVHPLKTGHGRLALDFIQPLSPGGGCRRSAELRVIQRGPEHLVGSLKDADGFVRTAIVSVMTFDWLASYCPEHFRRRHPSQVTMTVNGEPAWENTPETHLDRVFGRSEDEIVHGASARRFGVELKPMPEQSSTFMLDVECPPLDSLMIARGFVPQEMEEKWFVFLADGSLRFHRSWTGVLVYEVEAEWRGERLYLGSVRANRDPEQYGETDDDHDAAMLRWIIDVVLRGVPSTFPMKTDEAPLQAWASAGSASL